jgi:CrcB protein
MQHILLIALGGSLGAIARFGLSAWIEGAAGEIFPWGTLAVNCTGAFLLGAFVELFDSAIVPPQLRSFIAIGFLGAYTTFSTFTLETVNLFREGELRLALFNLLAANALSIGFLVAGIFASRLILKTLS